MRPAPRQDKRKPAPTLSLIEVFKPRTGPLSSSTKQLHRAGTPAKQQYQHSPCSLQPTQPLQLAKALRPPAQDHFGARAALCDAPAGNVFWQSNTCWQRDSLAKSGRGKVPRRNPEHQQCGQKQQLANKLLQNHPPSTFKIHLLLCQGAQAQPCGAPDRERGEVDKVGDAGVAGEAAQPVEPQRLDEVVQRHHRLQLVPALAGAPPRRRCRVAVPKEALMPQRDQIVFFPLGKHEVGTWESIEGQLVQQDQQLAHTTQFCRHLAANSRHSLPTFRRQRLVKVTLLDLSYTGLTKLLHSMQVVAQ